MAVDAKTKRNMVAAVIGVSALSLFLPQVTSFLAMPLFGGFTLGQLFAIVQLWAAYSVAKKGTFA